MDAKRIQLRAADGRTLEVVVAGPEDGTLVLMHHGTPGSAGELWPPHVETALARGLRLACYSRPGYAGSERDEARNIASCVPDAAAVADELGAERFFTVGGSGGGPHALACAALLSDRVLATATIGGVAPADAEGLDWLAGMGDENIEEFGAATEGPDALEAFINRWADELRQISADQVLASLGDLVSPPDAAVLTGEYAAHAAAGIRDSLSTGIWGWLDDDLAHVGSWGFDLAAVDSPVSIWQGRQDRFVPPAHGEWLAANVPSAKPHLLDEHGHLSLALASFDQILDGLIAASQSST